MGRITDWFYPIWFWWGGMRAKDLLFRKFCFWKFRKEKKKTETKHEDTSFSVFSGPGLITRRLHK